MITKQNVQNKYEQVMLHHFRAFRQLKEGYVWRLSPYNTNFFTKLLVPELEAPTQVAKVHPEWASCLQQFMKHASGPMKSRQAIVEIWCNWMKFVEVPWGQEVYLSLSLSLFLYISLPQGIHLDI